MAKSSLKPTTRNLIKATKGKARKASIAYIKRKDKVNTSVARRLVAQGIKDWRRKYGHEYTRKAYGAK